MKRYRSDLTSRAVPVVLLLCMGCGWGQRQTYMREPILRDQPPVKGSPASNAITTTAEPSAPPRPILPQDEPFARIPLVPGNKPPFLVDRSEPPVAIDGPALPAVPLLPADVPSHQPLALTTGAQRGMPAPPPTQSVAQAFLSAPLLPQLNAPEPKPTGILIVEHRRAATLGTPVRDLTALPGHFAFDPDYRRLKGRVDRGQRGDVYLRYRDVQEDDPWGGKVRLADDPRWGELGDGMCIEIEGVLQPLKKGEQFPTYIVHEFRILN